MAKKIIVVEVEDDNSLREVIDTLRERGAQARVKPDPSELRKRILKRWEKTGRRSKPGELKGVGLEDEFD